MDPFDLIDSIETKHDLANYIRQLALDFQENKDRWENWTIDHYLESIAAWIDSSRDDPDWPAYLGEPSWREFAKILGIGSVYE